MVILLRIILIIGVIYYILKVIGKLVFASVINQAKTNVRENQQQTQQKREGEVTLITDTKNASNKKSKEGDYVEFEEIK